MALFDLSEAALRAYRPGREEPDDFDTFWTRTLEEARALAPGPRFEPVEVPLTAVEVFDVTFGGAGGSPVRGWLVLPRRRGDGLPCVVEFLGYGGGRGLPHEWLLYASAGYAHLVMDTRGQGGGWRRGDTPDPGAGGEPHTPGFLTQGIRDPHTYYYRRLYADAARAVETARAHPGIDPSRVAVTGSSQSGGLALAAAGLVPDLAACLPDVPFLCHFGRAIRLTDQLPYAEVAGYLRVHRDALPEVTRTLAYFDGMHFAARARARALFSVALMDDVCPPSTVYAAYNHYAGEKRIASTPSTATRAAGPSTTSPGSRSCGRSSGRAERPAERKLHAQTKRRERPAPAHSESRDQGGWPLRVWRKAPTVGAPGPGPAWDGNASDGGRVAGPVPAGCGRRPSRPPPGSG